MKIYAITLQVSTLVNDCVQEMLGRRLYGQAVILFSITCCLSKTTSSIELKIRWYLKQGCFALPRCHTSD